MKLPLSWFTDYVEIDKEPEKLATSLTLSGTKVDEILTEGGDTAFEFEITPNRADCFSVYGIAREIAALTHQELKEMNTQLQYQEKSSLDPLKLTIKEKGLCLSYALGVFENVTTTSSPEKIKDRLNKSGIRAIDCIVDVTNYVMLETGIPSHAFDYDKIKGHKMALRSAQKGERVKTLDGIDRELPGSAIVIEDSEKLVDLAGLMGGENSAIDRHTKRVGLLVPVYNPVNIRRTSLALNLRSEASGRFEKALDPTSVKDAFYRIARLFFETAGARLASEVTIYQENPVQLKTVEISLGEIENHLGIVLLGEDLINYLTPLGFLVKHLPQEGIGRFAITVPSWRTDVALKVDIIEEVARLHGYNSFPKTLPTGDVPTHPDSFTPDWERVGKEVLTATGVSEIMTYTLVSEEIVGKAGFNPDKTVKILNPNSQDFVYLRPSLLPLGLQALSLNLKNYPSVSLFEIGKVFAPGTKDLPIQDRQLAIFTTGDFATLKGFLVVLANKFNIPLSYSTQKERIEFAAGLRGDIYLGKEKIGEIGTLSSSLLQKFDIQVPITFANLDFEKLTAKASLENKYEPLPKYPLLKEDLAVLVSEEVTTDQLVNLVAKEGKPLLIKVEPFDYFVSSKLGEGKKSIALSLTFGAGKTLTGEEVAKVRTKIINALKKTLQAEIR